MTKKVAQPQDKYVLRMPDGLRDRIKIYAERHGRSMNTEIIRVLEREFPEQWQIDTRMSQLVDMMHILKEGPDDPRFDEFVIKFRETVEGIASGRVTGISPHTRLAIANLWQEMKEREEEATYEAQQEAEPEYERDEQEALRVTGRPEKYAIEPIPFPDPFRDAMELRNLIPPMILVELRHKLERGDIEGARQSFERLSPESLESFKRHVAEEERQREIRESHSFDDPFQD